MGRKSLLLGRRMRQTLNLGQNLCCVTIVSPLLLLRHVALPYALAYPTVQLFLQPIANCAGGDFPV